MRVLVVGGSGFIGRNFLLRTDPSWECFATHCTSTTFTRFLKEYNLTHVKPVYVNIMMPVFVNDVLDEIGTEFDFCLYAMGNSDIGKSSTDPMLDLENNVSALLNLIERIHVKKLIFISSGAVYEGYSGLVNPSLPVNPTIPYAITKLASERYIEYFKKHTNHIDNYLILRFFGAFGPMELPRKIYTKLVKAFATGKETTFSLNGNGKNYIDAMYIDDMIEALLKMANGDIWNKTLDFCFGHSMSINDLVAEAASAFSVENFIIDHIGETPEYTTFYASPIEVERLFGFIPKTSLHDGFRNLRDYFILQGGL